MKKQYLLPCQCGEKITIETSQAGQQISCQCGLTIEAPALRGFRDLELVEESPDANTKALGSRSWNRSQGVLFAFGLFITVVSFTYASWAAYNRYVFDQYSSYFLTQESELGEYLFDQLDEMPNETVWDIWTEVRDEQLGPQEPPVYIHAQQDSKNWGIVLKMALILGSIGLSMTLGSFFIGTSKRNKAP